MIFTAPLLLLALAALPILWWLLRVTPPAPKTQSFPAIRLLLGLRAEEQTAARTPWWLLLLRLVAAALVIVGLAGPVLDPAGGLAGRGPLLLVLDNGWAAAPDWTTRLAAAGQELDRAERTGRDTMLLTTARNETDAAPAVSPAMPASDLRRRLAALRPEPWPPDRAAAAAALRAVHADAVVYLADGVATAADPAFAEALAAVGPLRELRANPVTATVLRPPQVETDRLVAHVDTLPQPAPLPLTVLAQTGDGRTIARADTTVPPGASHAEAELQLPAEIRNQIARLALEGPPSAGAVMLLDERWRRRPVGLLAEQSGADTPLIGTLYYAQRALQPFTELRQGSLASLLSRPLSMLILADTPLSGDDAAAVAKWVEQGGLLVRFAGPRMAEASSDPTQSDQDPLLPVKLLAGDRQLGGALSWSEPASLATFPTGSPFVGLSVPAEVKVKRQLLAEPSADLSGHVWASLVDGTPLVTATTRGAGRIVLFGVTANADWSDLPLSGLFVDMLRRLVDLSAGVATTADDSKLAPFESLDGFGALAPPPPAALAASSRELQSEPVSPRHPPGIYGPPSNRRTLNLGATLPPLTAAAPVAGATVQTLSATGGERVLGPSLLAAALLVLAVDLILSLALRGLLRWQPATVGAALLAVSLATPAHADDTDQYKSLAPRLAFVQTGDPTVDATSQSGLKGLSTYVNRRTAVTLADPVAVVPGQDDLSFYPLLYWPITTDLTLPAEAIDALNDFTREGGIILIDTRNSGSGEGFAPGTDEALKRLTGGLDVPPLAPLTSDHVLARAFYLLTEFPGRYTGGTVWVQRDQDRANDSVSPVIIGGNDWAAAWAIDASGHYPYATIPGGDRQRTLAYRFGVNLVMYALTGNYKGDQVHVPAILERLGQ